jgi:hypothetical protein
MDRKVSMYCRCDGSHSSRNYEAEGRIVIWKVVDGGGYKKKKLKNWTTKVVKERTTSALALR